MSRIAICNSYEVILQEKNEKVNIMGGLPHDVRTWFSKKENKVEGLLIKVLIERLFSSSGNEKGLYYSEKFR
mgnify:CR=1 FL=1